MHYSTCMLHEVLPGRRHQFFYCYFWINLFHPFFASTMTRQYRLYIIHACTYTWHDKDCLYTYISDRQAQHNYMYILTCSCPRRRISLCLCPLRAARTVLLTTLLRCSRKCAWGASINSTQIHKFSSIYGSEII